VRTGDDCRGGEGDQDAQGAHGDHFSRVERVACARLVQSSRLDQSRPAGGRFIDILAVDENNDYLVVELKVSRGYDRVIGQLLRYMAWVGRHLAERINAFAEPSLPE
jgi:hypothetical protein